MQTLLCHSLVENALSSATLVPTLCLYGRDGLSPGRWQVGGLQHPRPRQDKASAARPSVPDLQHPAAL
jgi:hypothetical protein